LAAERRARKTSRQAAVDRKTRETRVSARVDLDGTGQAEIETGIGMLDHLLSQVARHGMIDITLNARGDLSTDEHHTVEDAGLALGQAVGLAIGEGAGIVRMADATVPMDEALAVVAVDVSGRGQAVVDVEWSGERMGELPADLLPHLLAALASEARITLHAKVLAGVIDHHKAEAMFKALGRALGAATRIEPRLAGRIPSTKGRLRA
jgi:imidazoleglycerol-phosphate dehydratase